MSDIHTESCNKERLVTISSFTDNLGISFDFFKQAERSIIYQKFAVNGIGFRLADFSENTGSPGVSVLNIGTGFTIEIEELIPVKNNVFDALVVQVIEQDGANPDNLCDFILVRDVRVFLFDDGLCLIDRFIQQILCKDDISFAGRDFSFFETDKTIRNMYKILCIFISHEFNYLENLSEVELLLLAVMAAFFGALSVALG